ncbi:hypothetical protein PY092_17500 [Muricauda sp. 334s03]|uniref:Anti-bacteriophage protein A/HamA C-terminal domain-containing protein n=1 Tax=Flagellimonas yonaguniensis TaxID=3031325 RepID=A0ABT5Y3D0_9FLAO|nr:hypothetical protein [[Muricauda] yonaguniensis]MDF0717963.1 hypothetical protein [[Muricauda] yonaguniensis]
MAKKISEINWSKLLKVDSAHFTSWFNLADERIIGGANIKFYGLKFKNGKPDYKGFIEYLFAQTEKYVFDEKEIIEIKEDGDSPQEKALSVNLQLKVD